MDHLKDPAGAQTREATKQNLKTGPADKPMWGGRMGEQQVGQATKMDLSHTANPVANLGNRPGRHGMEQVTSTRSPLSRMTNSPYTPCSATTPETPLKKG
jgi:hypothetical protein